MITDAFTIFSGAVSSAGALSGQAITGAANVVSTNSIDTGPRSLGNNQPVDIGAGTELDFCISVLVAPADPTSIEFQIIQADDGALTSNVQVLDSTGAIPIASLPVGTNVFMTPASNVRASKRYVGIRYVVAGTNTNAGTYFAALVANRHDKPTFYRGGFAVS